MKNFLYKDLYDLEESHWWHISKRTIASKLILRFKRGSKLKILDIGCGTGKNVEEFSAIGETWGVDNSNEALKFCRNHRKLINIKKGDAQKLDFKNETFDVVTLLDVLEHVDEEKTLREISRVLKANGILIITVPAYQWMWSKWDEVLHHKRRYTSRRLKNTLEGSGFKVLKTSYLYSFLLLPVFIVRKIKERFQSDNYSSDFKLSSKIVNTLLLTLAQTEQQIALKLGIPFGLSIVVVASKKK